MASDRERELEKVVVNAAAALKRIQREYDRALASPYGSADPRGEIDQTAEWLDRMVARFTGPGAVAQGA